MSYTSTETVKDCSESMRKRINSKNAISTQTSSLPTKHRLPHEVGFHQTGIAESWDPTDGSTGTHDIQLKADEHSSEKSGPRPVVTPCLPQSGPTKDTV